MKLLIETVFSQDYSVRSVSYEFSSSWLASNHCFKAFSE